MRKLFFLVSFWCSVCCLVNARGASPMLSIDSSQMMIGEQTLLHLSIAYDKRDYVQFPIFMDSIGNSIEILEVKKIDTIYHKKDGKGEMKQDILITSFNEGLYYIDSLPVMVNGDTLYSNGVQLKVLTYDIDSTNTKIYDIKPIMKVPFVWLDYHPYLVLVLFVLFILFVGIYIRQHRHEWHSIKDSFVKKEEIIRPPFEVAMEELEKIKEEKIYLAHKEKEFYTQLTEVLRIYIEGRFGVKAMEKTSSEIIEEMHSFEEAREVLGKLKEILLLSDFVKFAKTKPTEFENESSLVSALNFVLQTKPTPSPEETIDEEGKDVKESHTSNTNLEEKGGK